MAGIYIAPEFNDNGVMTDVFIQTKSDAVLNDDGSTVQSHVSDNTKHILSCLHTKVGNNHRLSDGNLGVVSGSNTTITDAANTNAHSFVINGITTIVGTGNKSPDNPYSFSGVSSCNIISGNNNYSVTLQKPLYDLNDKKDIVDIVNGLRLNNIGMLKFVGTENWQIYSTSGNSTSICFYIDTFTNRDFTLQGLNDRFVYNSNLLDATVTNEGYYLGNTSDKSTLCYIRINKVRLTGWDEALTDAQKVTLFKTWLTTNNTTFLYQLANTTYDNITPMDIMLSSGTCVVSINISTFVLNYFKEVPNLNMINFIATADFNLGDTFRINGSVLTTKMSNGNALYNNVFKSGGYVIGKINGSNFLLNVTDGGNADTVDGKHAIDFVTRAIGCTGSCDTYFQAGWFTGIFTNYPTALPDGQGILIVHPYGTTSTSAGYTQQEFISAQTSIKYTRRAANGVWESWKVVYGADNISTASVANADKVGGLSASDLGGMVIGTTAPTQTTKGWIDTGNGGVLKYYNGSAWVAAKSVWG